MHDINAFEFVFTRFPTRWGQTCLPCSSCSAVDDGTKNSLQRYGDRSKWTASDVGEAQDVNLHHARAHTHTRTHTHTHAHTHSLSTSLDLSRPLSTSLCERLRWYICASMPRKPPGFRSAGVALIQTLRCRPNWRSNSSMASTCERLSTCIRLDWKLNPSRNHSHREEESQQRVTSTGCVSEQFEDLRPEKRGGGGGTRRREVFALEHF